MYSLCCYHGRSRYISRGCYYVCPPDLRCSTVCYRNRSSFFIREFRVRSYRNTRAHFSSVSSEYASTAGRATGLLSCMQLLRGYQVDLNSLMTTGVQPEGVVLLCLGHSSCSDALLESAVVTSCLELGSLGTSSGCPRNIFVSPR